ncbi:MAG: flagellar basal body P-ring formation protein FlgA [Nitrospirae bacterium]|nr:flagellar basal body P-ring formation protein FlgA [Candidatus Troglogloeales bacterium]
MKKQIFKIVVCSLILFLPAAVHIAEGSGAVLSEEKVADKMKSAIRDYVSTRLQKDPIRIDVKAITPILTGKIRSERDVVEVAQGPEEGGGRGLMGRGLFLLSVKQQSGSVSENWVTAEVSVVRKVLVATRPIKRKERVEPDSLAVLTFYQVKPDALYAETSDELLGKQAQRLILPGTPITLDMVEDAPVMSKGDRVTLFVATEGIIVSATGQAKEDGFLGRQVGVILQDGNKPIYGTVVSASKVEVLF